MWPYLQWRANEWASVSHFELDVSPHIWDDNPTETREVLWLKGDLWWTDGKSSDIIWPFFQALFCSGNSTRSWWTPGSLGPTGVVAIRCGVATGGNRKCRWAGCLRNRKSGGKTAEELQEQLNAAFHNSKEARKDQEVAKKGGNYTDNGKEKLEHLRQES